MHIPTYKDQLRAFRETYSNEIARDYWDQAVDTYLDVNGPPNDDHALLMAMAFAAAETTVNVEIDTYVRNTLEMIPDYIIRNDDGTWTVMLYETQREVRVTFGMMPVLINNPGTRPVRDLINDPDYTV